MSPSGRQLHFYVEDSVERLVTKSRKHATESRKRLNADEMSKAKENFDDMIVDNAGFSGEDLGIEDKNCGMTRANAKAKAKPKAKRSFAIKDAPPALQKSIEEDDTTPSQGKVKGKGKRNWKGTKN